MSVDSLFGVAALVACGVHPTHAKACSTALAAQAPRHGVDTPERAAAFLGQALVETANMAALEENLFYRSGARIFAVWPRRFQSAADAEPFARAPRALANRVYAGRLGNGDEASGDGWRYRGRGLLMTTGRNGYEQAQTFAAQPYVQHPELLSQPAHAATSAFSYWTALRLNEPADRNDWDAITRAVNGPAMLKRAERAKASRAALAAFYRTIQP